MVAYTRCVLHIPNLLVGGVHYVENEGYLLEVFMMSFFNQTLSMYDECSLSTTFMTVTDALPSPSFSSHHPYCIYVVFYPANFYGQILDVIDKFK